MNKLPISFYQRDTILVAKELLGKYLIHIDEGIKRVGKIVEVEAYLGQHDLACHSSRGRTARTEVMFGPGGFSYVYLIYGIYYCTNIITENEGIGCGVLLRAIEPVKNIESRTQGPGLLSKAMGIDKRLNGHNMQSDDFYIAEDNQPSELLIVEKPRIGVKYANEWAKELLRFYIKNNAFVSKR